MTFNVRIAPEAEEELGAGAVWYESKRGGLGAEFVAAIDEALEWISESPCASPIWNTGLPFRRHRVRRFPYVIFFDLSDDCVFVLGIAHAKRRPGYWLAR